MASMLRQFWLYKRVYWRNISQDLFRY